MNLKSKFYYALSFLAMPSMALADEGLAGVVNNVTNNVKSFTNLLAIILILVGMYCIYQLVMTFMNRDEGNRDYPMKNVPYYFIGAALGIGAMALNDVVLETLFGDRSDVTGGDSDFWSPDKDH